MKKVYFVRHGQSAHNQQSIHQDGSGSLSEEGVKQANYIAERVSDLSIETIFSSSMVRAHETAQVIADKLDKPLETSDLFVERRRPSEQIGRSSQDPEYIHSEEVIRKNFHLSDFRFSNEENFNDLKERAKQALDLLANQSQENILVVTHGFIMRIILAYVVFGDDLTGEECEQFIRVFHMENTGLSVLCFDEIKKKWWLWVWNDHSHLG